MDVDVLTADMFEKLLRYGMFGTAFESRKKRGVLDDREGEGGGKNSGQCLTERWGRAGVELERSIE